MSIKDHPEPIPPRHRKVYTKEFKESAVRLADEKSPGRQGSLSGCLRRQTVRGGANCVLPVPRPFLATASSPGWRLRWLVFGERTLSSWRSVKF